GDKVKEKDRTRLKKAKESFAHPELGKPGRIYRYTDENGKVIFCVCRFRLQNGKKTFSQCKSDGLSWSTKGTRLVLYNLPEIKDASHVAFVDIAEDEKVPQIQG
ncbi:MAG: hypothetical protein JRG77_09975, partial [Deltaproteobacteria bacterium]|nr:hypothetical protein [Deltaproteobacteria bacterium]